MFIGYRLDGQYSGELHIFIRQIRHALWVVSAGVASALVFWAMAIAMFCYMRYAHTYRQCRLFTHWVQPDWQQIYRIVKLGFPIALALFCEVTPFCHSRITIVTSGLRDCCQPSGSSIGLFFPDLHAASLPRLCRDHSRRKPPLARKIPIKPALLP